ncbi:hypothetical protein JNW88_08225 [Micromonospora sp. ATA32]|nr:hypothetical protein [Micromonospora sp. ATA32]
MTDTTTTKPPSAAASTPRQRGTTRPTVSVRPAAVGAANAATIAGATVVAAGGGAVLAALAGGGSARRDAMGARKKGQAKAKRERSITITRTATGSGSRGSGGGGLGRAGRSGAASPGSRSAGSRTGAGRAGGGGNTSRGGGFLPKLGRSNGGSSTAGSGHRRAGSAPRSSSRSPLTSGKVAAARRKLANRRQPGPRMSDAVRAATTPAAGGKKPTAREAFRTARRAVTGDNPKNRGPLRRAAAGLVAGGLAAGKAAYDSRQRRKKRDAARQAKQDRIAARTGQPRVGTTVRRPSDATNTTRQRKPAPTPVRAQHGPFKGTIIVPHDTTCALCGGQLVANEWAYASRARGLIGQCCGHRITAEDLANAATDITPSEGLITMTHPLLAISEDFLAAAARNQPEGMLQVTAEAHIMPQVMENIVKAMKIRFDRAQEHPLHESIKEMYGLVHKAQVSVHQAAEEIGPAIEKIHEHELNRLRNQRVGEAMWDVARNRGAM